MEDGIDREDGEREEEKEEVRRGTDDNETILREKKVCCGSCNRTSLQAWSLERFRGARKERKRRKREKRRSIRGALTLTTSPERRSGGRGGAGGGLSVVRIEKKKSKLLFLPFQDQSGITNHAGEHQDREETRIERVRGKERGRWKGENYDMRLAMVEVCRGDGAVDIKKPRWM